MYVHVSERCASSSISSLPHNNIIIIIMLELAWHERALRLGPAAHAKLIIHVAAVFFK